MTVTPPPAARPGGNRGGLLGYAASLLLVAGSAAGGAYVGLGGLPPVLGGGHWAEGVVEFPAVQRHVLRDDTVRPDQQSYLESQAAAARSNRVVDQAAADPAWVAAVGTSPEAGGADALAAGLLVRTDGKSLLRIAVRHRDPATAKAGAAAVTAAFANHYREREAESFGRGLDALDQRRATLRNEVGALRERIRAVTHETGTVGGLDAAVAAATDQYTRAEAALAEARLAVAVDPPPAAAPVPGSRSAPAVPPRLAVAAEWAAEARQKLLKLGQAQVEVRAAARELDQREAALGETERRLDLLRFEHGHQQRLLVHSAGELVDPNDPARRAADPPRPGHAAAGAGAGGVAAAVLLLVVRAVAAVVRRRRRA